MVSISYVGDRPERVDPEQALAALIARGYVVASAGTVRRVRLDTFDGRLHARGMRLDVITGRGVPRRLVLEAPGSPPAEIVGAPVPRFATDLAVGPFRSRIDTVIEVRALLPIVTVELEETVLVLHKRGRLRSTVLVHELDTDAAPGVWVAEIIGHPGHEEIVAEVGAELVAAGAVAWSGDVIDLVAMLTEVDQAGATSNPNVALDRSMPALDGMIAVLTGQRRVIAQQWAGVLARTDVEFLHDLRVALRRTRSVLSQSATIIDPDDRLELAAGFRWFTAATSSPRDLDVLALDWPSRTAGIAAAARRALEPVRNQLLADRDAAHQHLAATMTSDEASDLFRSYDEFLADPTHLGNAVLGPDAGRPLGKVIAAQITAAHRRVVRDGRAIDDDSVPERLHDLRKDTKKLRYRIECFAGLLPHGATAPFIKRLKGLQDVLGRYQDAQVHADELRLAVRELQQVGGLGPQAEAAAGELIAGLERSSAAAREEFGERFTDFDGADTRRELDRLIEALRP